MTDPYDGTKQAQDFAYVQSLDANAGLRPKHGKYEAAVLDFISDWKRELTLLGTRTSGVTVALSTAVLAARNGAPVEKRKGEYDPDDDDEYNDRDVKRVEAERKKQEGKLDELVARAASKESIREAKSKLVELESKLERAKKTAREKKKKTPEKVNDVYPPVASFESALKQVKQAVRLYLSALEDLQRDFVSKGMEVSEEERGLAKRLIDAQIFAELDRDPGVAPGSMDRRLNNTALRGIIADARTFISSFNKKAKPIAQGKIALLDDQFTQTLTALADVIRIRHAEVVKAVTVKHTAVSALRSRDAMPLYVLKLMRVGTAYAASFVAARLFDTMYVNSVNGGKTAVPDLKWMVVAYMSFLALFDGAFLAVLWMLRRFDLGGIRSGLVKDFVVDTFVADALAFSSLLWMADVVQDRRYFEYQLAAPRALRVMRQLCFTVSGVHAAVPYFYLSGPFYVHKQRGAVRALASKQPATLAPTAAAAVPTVALPSAT